jgi:UDP-N-acetylmuramate dehydrogenase
MSAGMLIDQAGLKGTRVGGAEVSDRHANFIVAAEGTTSDDVLKLIDQVRERVLERLGVELELEIEVW